jgi:hypothetical protein
MESSNVKKDLIARLKALGAELGREVNLSGSNEEMALRIAELEEELNDDDACRGQMWLLVEQWMPSVLIPPRYAKRPCCAGYC